MEFEDIESREAALYAGERAGEGEPSPFTAMAGMAAALLWLGGVLGVAFTTMGADRLAGLDPALQALLVAGAFGPAILFWLIAAAAGEAHKAHRLASALIDLVRETKFPETQNFTATPAPSVDHAELRTLTEAVNAALARLDHLDESARNQALLFTQGSGAPSAHDLLHGLATEREAITALHAELRDQAEAIGHSVSRHVRLMREASKLVTDEIIAAEDTLENQLASFHNAAIVMGDKTAAVQDAAAGVQDATLSLDGAMGLALEGLGEAAKLTQLAKRTVREAADAAKDTAAAVNETTKTAIVEAQKAASFVRAETQALQEMAEATLAKLRDAAQAAREASEDALAAADRHALAVERRRARAPSARGGAPAGETPAKAGPRLVANANETRREPAFAGLRGGIVGWSNLAPATARAQDAAEEASNDAEDAFEAFGAAELASPEERLVHDVFHMIAASGVDLDKALPASALEHVAREARFGAQARRRAVAERAPAALGRLSRHMRRHEDAQRLGEAFRSRPELTHSQARESDSVRAYLLLDAALA